MKKPYNTFLLLTLFIIIFTISVSAQFVRVISEVADIKVRVLPETESIMVGEAFKDDIFKYISEENDWIEIEMFSGDARYIHRSLVEILTRGVSAPFSDDICLKLMERLEEAKERSLTESDAKSQNVLFDRYVLDIFHEYGLQPVVFKIAINRCIDGLESKIIQRPFEIEADYTLGVPIEKPEFYDEAFLENTKYAFRQTYWGMSKEQVKKAERESILVEEDAKEDIYKAYDGSLYYQGELNGIKCEIHYQFMKDRLITARYRRTGNLRFKEEYINNFKNLKRYFVNIYGRPLYDGIEMLGDESIAPFALSSWENPTDNIYLILLDLMTYEGKGQIGWSITYQSEEGKNIVQSLSGEDKHDFQEEIKKEVETQTETKTKQLANQPKAEIKFIDSTNRLKRNYYYVEGILKNNGKVTASYVKVGIRALDKYGKLVSIHDGYADPSTIAPGQEATYQIMIEYDSKIDKFDKRVSWSND